MAKNAGRLCVLRKDGTAIAGLRTSSMQWNGTPIDVTDVADGAVATMLADVLASETLELSADGYTDGDALRAIALGATQAARHLSDISLAFGDGAILTGNFIVTSYSETGTYQDGVTFNITLQRTGAHTYTPAPT